MPVDPANVRELANIAEEIGAVVIDGPLRYPSETGSWQLGGVDLGEFLAQHRDQQVVLIVAPGKADPGVILCGICDFPMKAAGDRQRCALLTREVVQAVRRAVDQEQLMGGR